MENHLGINSQFIPYNLALKLKELGFNEECLMLWEHTDFWTNLVRPEEFKKVVSERYCQAPSWDQAFNWVRENHNLHSYITATSLGDFAVFITDNYDKHLISNNKLYNNAVHCTYTYEEARQACLEKLIEYMQKESVGTYKH